MNLMLAMVLSVLPQGEAPRLDAPGFTAAANGVHICVVTIPGTAQLAIGIAVPLGYQHDPDGAAGLDAVAAGGLAMMVQRQLPPQTPMRVEVLPDCTLFTVLGRAADTTALLAAAAALCRGTDAGDADVLALARAHQALLADDAEHVYPGPVLQSRANRALGRGTASGHWLRGEPLQVQALTDAAVRQRAAAFGSGEVWIAIVGEVDAATWQATASWQRQPTSLAAEVVRSLPDDGPLSQPLPDLGGPFVACAMAAPPPDAASLAFALAMAVVQQRSVVAFQEQRGRELQAQALACSYDWLRGDRVAMLTRRGADAAAMAAPRAELERLLQQLEQHPIEPQELQLAVQRLATELSLPPYPPALQRALQRAPEGLLPRARVLALSGRRQWPIDMQQQLAQVSLAAVQLSLSAAFEPTRRWWGAVERPPTDQQR